MSGKLELSEQEVFAQALLEHVYSAFDAILNLGLVNYPDQNTILKYRSVLSKSIFWGRGLRHVYGTAGCEGLSAARRDND